MANTSQKKTSRKAGRNKAFCERYRLRNQREQNKGRRLVRYIVKHPADLVALKALRRISKLVSGFGPKLKELEALKPSDFST